MKNRVWMLVCVAVLSICAVGTASEQVEVTDNVRMRAEPNISTDVIGTAPRGAIVPLLGQQGSWYKIRHNDTEGWIYNKYTRPVRSAAGNVFTKQDASVLRPDLDDFDAEPQQQKYVRIRSDNTLIRAFLDPNAPFVCKVRRGDVLPLIGEGASWCRVVCEDTSGWVRHADIEILDEKPTASIAVSDAKNVLIGLIAGGALILIIIAIITYRHIRIERKRKVYVQKNALILAKEDKTVQYMLTNTTNSLEHCFTEIGFNVSVLKDSVSARNAIEHGKPDIILVDWEFEPSIFVKIDNLFVRSVKTSAPHFLFYNVPDLAATPSAKALPHVSFLGLAVSDRDIFKVVTPIIAKREEEAAGKAQKSQEEKSALEGIIAGGNLLEVLQFIEIGCKTGCLRIETKGPYGVIYFGDGRITYAAAEMVNKIPQYQGVEAVYAILNLSAGRFSFINNKQPKAANLNLPTLSVLMEWTKEKDEAHRS